MRPRFSTAVLEGPDGPVVQRPPPSEGASGVEIPLIESAPSEPAAESEQTPPRRRGWRRRGQKATPSGSSSSPLIQAVPKGEGLLFPDADDEEKDDEEADGNGPGMEGCWFRTQVFLPNNCPVLRAEGPPQPKRSIAVAAACIQAVRLLHQVCYGLCPFASYGCYEIC